jgi:hypothetical protein
MKPVSLLVLALLVCVCGPDASGARAINGLGLGTAGTQIYGLIATGQSLATGDFGTPPISTTSDGSSIQLHDSSGIYDITNPEATTLSAIPLIAPIRADKYGSGGGDSNPYPTNIGGESPEVAASMTVHAKLHVQVAASNVGQGSSSYTVIMKGGTGNAYAASLFEAQAFSRLVAGYRPLAILLTHGESDALTSDYLADLEQFANNYQQDLGAVMILSQQNSEPLVASGGPGEPSNQPLSTLAQLAAFQAQPNNIIGCCTKYQYTYVDDVHLINTNYQEYGEKLAEPIYNFFKTGGWNWKPLYETSVTRSGAVATVTMNVPFAPVVTDSTVTCPHGTGTTYGDGGSVFGAGHTGWTAGKGFECWSGGYGTTPIGINSISISGNQVTVNCSSNPASMTISYALTTDRTTIGDGTGGFPDGRCGCIHDSDTWAGPLSGVAQPNWLWAFYVSGL